MIGIILARRYAKALFEAAQGAGAVDTIAADLAAIDAVVADSGVRRVVVSPEISGAVRGQVVARLGEGRHALTRNLLGVLARRRRTAILPELRAAFDADVRESRGEVTGVVESARSLGSDALAEVEQLAGKLAGGRTVYLTVRENPSLIGGIRLKIGNTLFDGSVATQLDELHKRLMEAPIV